MSALNFFFVFALWSHSADKLPIHSFLYSWVLKANISSKSTLPFLGIQHMQKCQVRVFHNFLLQALIQMNGAWKIVFCLNHLNTAPCIVYTKLRPEHFSISCFLNLLAISSTVASRWHVNRLEPGCNRFSALFVFGHVQASFFRQIREIHIGLQLQAEGHYSCKAFLAREPDERLPIVVGRVNIEHFRIDFSADQHDEVTSFVLTLK